MLHIDQNQIKSKSGEVPNREKKKTKKKKDKNLRKEIENQLSI